MDIQIDVYRDDNTEVKSWYAQVDPEGLRGNLGLVARRGKQMIAAGFLIPTHTKLCLWDFVKSNPEASSFSRAKAIILLAQTAERWARDQGFKSLLGWIPPHRKDLEKAYLRLNAQVSSETYRSVTRRL